MTSFWCPANFEHISPFLRAAVVDFEQVNVNWVTF